MKNCTAAFLLLAAAWGAPRLAVARNDLRVVAHESAMATKSILAGGRVPRSADSTHSLMSGFSLHGYGSINYFAYDWQTQPNRRNQVDLERLVLYPSYRFSERFSIDAELEIEHGGTGATLEFERREEFGEFEQEIEKGGEVKLEQLNLNIRLRPYFNVRIGRMKVPFGLAAVNDEPPEYLTTTRAQMEVNMIPTNWYESGLQIYGQFAFDGLGAFAYHASLVNGLTSTGFGANRWIAGGHQERFEMVNAQDLAVAVRLDYRLGEESAVGVSAYYGDSADNRPKPDLAVDAHVKVFDAHLTLNRDPLRVRALVLYGEVQNAAFITRANNRLPEALGSPGTPVGSAALGYSVAAAYDVLSLLLEGAEQRLEVFGRYAFYDTMYSTAPAVPDLPRTERTVYIGGLNYHVIDDIVFKAQYSHRVLGLSERNIENTFSLGLGFEF